MASQTIEQAFKRHPRPQVVPTKAALVERAIQKEKRASSLTKGVRESPWQTLKCQGELTQGTNVWSICVQQGEMALVKRTNLIDGREELEKVTRLSNHPNVATIKQAFESDSAWYFQFEYSRVTLEEVLSVHSLLEENHIRVIASSIFLAVKHVSTAGIVHSAISTRNIRFTSMGKPLLSNFEHCVWSTTERTTNMDLESLGVVVLECMHGWPNEDLRNPSEVRRLRELNKTFGLTHGERWSDQKLLIDFLDNMFSVDIPAIAKLQKPVRNTRSRLWDPQAVSRAGAIGVFCALACGA